VCCTSASPALTAGHVHAALVLLNGSVTLGARLGVGQDPVEVLTLSTVLGDPLAHCVTAHLWAAGSHISCLIHVDGRFLLARLPDGFANSCPEAGLQSHKATAFPTGAMTAYSQPEHWAFQAVTTVFCVVWLHSNKAVTLLSLYPCQCRPGAALAHDKGSPAGVPPPCS